MCCLSIIVPVYNVETYIDKCLRSIKEQKYVDYEVIIVDDGSTDRSVEIINRYIGEDKRFRYIYQNNSGVSAARNVGLRHAKGRYVTFVDPDDWLDENMYHCMINIAQEGNYDLVCCNWNVVDDQNNEIVKHPVKEGISINSNEEILLSTDIIGASVWNKIFRTGLVNEGFPEGIEIGEDWLFLARYCKAELKPIFIDKAFYYYRNRADSAMNQNRNKQSLALRVYLEIIDIAKGISLCCYQKEESIFLDKCLYYMTLIEDNDLYYYTLARNIYSEYIRKNMFSVALNPYIGIKQKVLYIKKYLFFENLIY